MKIRNGFVSNSSSSSFVCPVCQCSNEISYNNNVDNDTVKCELNHMLCIEHIDIDLLKKLCIEYLSHNGFYGKEEKKDIHNSFHGNLILYAFNEHDFKLSTEHCPVCNFSHINPDTIITFITKDDKHILDQIKEEIRTKYKNLKAMLEGIKQ